uniref:Hlh-1 n=1 Tax=Clytia hemisphaerica TaxID=252671 RepID=A0A0P0E7K3_9CNID|nr:Hlh-1 [Clytia hemisphaerica]
MAAASSPPQNWVFDYDLIESISVPGGDLPSLDLPGFSWGSDSFAAPTAPSVDFDGSFGNSEDMKETGSNKRTRSGSYNVSGSKACREKMRRDRLNDKFLELSTLLEPGRPPKTDKAAILVDAVRMVNQLRGEAQNLKDSSESLQEKITELKAEKNELRDEKQRLKAEKENLERQIKALGTQPGFFASPCCNSSSIFCPRPSRWWQTDAFHGVSRSVWIPWSFYVAVHATGCS